MKDTVERHISLLEKRLTIGIKSEELAVFYDVLEKMQKKHGTDRKGKSI